MINKLATWQDSASTLKEGKAQLVALPTIPTYINLRVTISSCVMEHSSSNETFRILRVYDDAGGEIDFRVLWQFSWG